jgi:hypothetical protein
MSILWILARSTGLAATVLLSAVMVLGILSSGDFRSRPWSRYLTNGLHRRVAYLACAMLGIQYRSDRHRQLRSVESCAVR